MSKQNHYLALLQKRRQQAANTPPPSKPVGEMTDVELAAGRGFPSAAKKRPFWR
jgi:hypothetical protein